MCKSEFYIVIVGVWISASIVVKQGSLQLKNICLQGPSIGKEWINYLWSTIKCVDRPLESTK